MAEFSREKCIQWGTWPYTLKCPFTLEGRVVLWDFGSCITRNACEASCSTGARVG